EEIKRGGISYSIDTIRSIKNRYSIGKEETIFIIGSDSLIELDTWKDPESILKESTVVVIKRYGYPVRKAREEYLRKVKMISLPQIDISSSEIRNRVRRGLSINYLVLPPVVDYIKRKGLYLR
ncbi:MAG: nicotinate-nicotinamide nucleotide adenylyltransferase, partial [Fidelibacterota bacterium]